MIDINAHVIKLVQNTVRKYASTAIRDFDEICSSLGLVAKEVPLSPTRDGLRTKQGMHSYVIPGFRAKNGSNSLAFMKSRII